MSCMWEFAYLSFSKLLAFLNFSLLKNWAGSSLQDLFIHNFKFEDSVVDCSQLFVEILLSITQLSNSVLKIIKLIYIY